MNVNARMSTEGLSVLPVREEMSEQEEDASVLTEIELRRLETIASNKAKLQELGLTDLRRYVRLH